MADNRIYLRCKQCAKTLFLGKHFMSAYFWENYKKDKEHLEDYLNKFFEEHYWCNEELDEKLLKCIDTPLGKVKEWDTMFEIAYEIDKDK